MPPNGVSTPPANHSLRPLTSAARNTFVSGSVSWTGGSRVRPSSHGRKLRRRRWARVTRRLCLDDCSWPRSCNASGPWTPSDTPRVGRLPTVPTVTASTTITPADPGPSSAVDGTPVEVTADVSRVRDAGHAVSPSRHRPSRPPTGSNAPMCSRSSSCARSAAWAPARWPDLWAAVPRRSTVSSPDSAVTAC